MNKVETITVPANEGHFQGELYIGPATAEVPADAKPAAASADDNFVVGHSETGHHHVVAASQGRLLETSNPLLAFLQSDGSFMDLRHLRDHDTHPTLRLEGRGVRKVVRQREMSPQGWTRALD